MNFDFILESGTKDAGREQRYREIYRLIDEAEHIYWAQPRECGLLLRRAALAICFVYNECYELGFRDTAELEEFLCYTGDEAHNSMVSLFLSVARKEQRDRLNKLRVLGDDCVLGEAAPSRGMLLQERMAQNARRMMETILTATADMCNRLDASGFDTDCMEFDEEALPDQPPAPPLPEPPKKSLWEWLFHTDKL